MRRLLVYALLGIVVLSGIAYIVYTPRDLQPVIIYKPQFADASLRDETQTTAHAEPRASKARALPQQQTHLSTAAVTEQQDPLQAALASPSYLEYSEKQAERVGFNVLLWWEFLEANGIAHDGRERQAEMFEKHFPDGGDYADYELTMRLTVAEMFFEDPSASVMDVLHRFNATQSHRVWRFGYFNGYEGEYEWGEGIQREVTDIVADAIHTQLPFEPSPSSVPQLPVRSQEQKMKMGHFHYFAPPSPTTNGVASVKSPELAPRLPTEIPTFPEIAPLPESLEPLEMHFFQKFQREDAVVAPDAEIQALLRGRFPHPRSETATHRLRTANPEVDTHIDAGTTEID